MLVFSCEWILWVLFIRSVWVSGGFSVFVEKRYSIIRIACRYGSCYASPCPWSMPLKWVFGYVFPIGCCVHQSDIFSVRGNSSCCASFPSIESVISRVRFEIDSILFTFLSSCILLYFVLSYVQNVRVYQSIKNMSNYKERISIMQGWVLIYIFYNY